MAVRKLGRKRFLRLAAVTASISAGLLIAYACHPNFLRSMAQASSQAQSFEWLGLPERVLKSGWGLFAFVGEPIRGPLRDPLTLVVAVTTAVIIGVLYFAGPLQSKRSIAEFVKASDWRGAFDTFFLLSWMIACVVGTYVAFLSLVHAMGDPRYLSVVWPYAAFLPVFLFRAMPGRKGWATLVLVPALLASNLAMAGKSTAPPKTASDIAAISQAERIVIGAYRRGLLPPLLVHIPDTTLLYVGYQSQLLDSSANWLEAFTPADLLVTHISHGNTREDLDSIASLVEQKLGIEVDEDTVGSKLQYIALSAHPPEPT
ncbi:MAG: hypothetical protein QGG73_13405 [Candidatus Hydrogenedentes bacterium]|nr:hypothetical protein [Candidatus Hydrogenedentota bacterium]